MFGNQLMYYLMEKKKSVITSSPHTTTCNNTLQESIKKTMQKQEEIFKHQVRELHRIYNLQKTTMKEEAMKKKSTQTRLRICNRYATSKWPPPPPPIRIEEGIEEDEVKLTLSIGGGQSIGDPTNKKPNNLCTSDHKSRNSSLSIEGRDVPNISESPTETSNKDKIKPFWLFRV